MQKTFNMMVIDHFGYLVSEYNFWVDTNLQKDPDFILEGFVEFQSPTTFVAVAIGFTEDRKAIYVREHMFQSDVDYLTQLKAER